MARARGGKSGQGGAWLQPGREHVSPRRVNCSRKNRNLPYLRSRNPVRDVARLGARSGESFKADESCPIMLPCFSFDARGRFHIARPVSVSRSARPRMFRTTGYIDRSERSAFPPLPLSLVSLRPLRSRCRALSICENLRSALPPPDLFPFGYLYYRTRAT